VPRLIIHAGPAKTGSTAIQRGLMKEAKALREVGIHFYCRPGPWQWALILPYRRDKLSTFLPLVLRRHFMSLEKALEWCEAEWRQFEIWIRSERPETVLISSEHLAFGGDIPALIERLSNSFDRINVIGFARHPVEAAVSALEQNIRTGWDLGSLPTFTVEPSNSAKFLRSYEKTLGRDHIHINRFSRSALHNGDVVADFFRSLCSLTGTSITTPPEISDENPGVCGAAVAWFLMVNEDQKIRSRSAEDFKAFFIRRKALIHQFRVSPAMAALPRVKLSDPVLENLILHRSKSTLEWVNSNHLKYRDQFALGKHMDRIPPDPEVRERVTTWLRGYLTPDAVDIIFREIVG